MVRLFKADLGNKKILIPFMKNSLVIGGTYQHYKTKNFYRVLAVAECLYANPKSNIWARPKEIFLEEVIQHGTYVHRFTLTEKLKAKPR
jgi:hypothetical protein